MSSMTSTIATATDVVEHRTGETPKPNPYASSSRFELEELLLSSRELIRRIVQGLARRYRFSEDAVKDLVSDVELKLIVDNYGVFRRFRGGSGLPTYLTKVVRNKCLDHVAGEWGKWRPTGTARRMGSRAVSFETLTRRDGYSDSEAIRTLVGKSQGEWTREELEDIAERLPPRTAPRGERYAFWRDSSRPHAMDNVTRRESLATLRACRGTLASLLHELSEEERKILEHRFKHGLNMREIEGRLGLKHRSLYNRLPRLLERLRQSLERAGFRREQVLSAIQALVDGGGDPDALWDAARDAECKNDERCGGYENQVPDNLEL